MSPPEVEEEPHFYYASFRVDGKIFLTVPPDKTHIHVLITDDEREIALALYPEFVEKLLWGGKVVGVRVALAEAKADVVNQLIRPAWSRKALERLSAAL